MISSTFFFLFSQLGVGMMLTLLFISPRSIGNSFFKFASLTAAILLGVTLGFNFLFPSPLRQSQLPVVLLFISAGLVIIYNRVVDTGKFAAAFALLIGATAFGIVSVATDSLAFNGLRLVRGPALVVGDYFQWEGRMLLLNHLAATALLGSVMLTMVFGHWYLVIPRLSIDPLKRLTKVLIAAITIRIVTMAASFAVLHFKQAVPFSAVLRELLIQQGIFFWPRVIFGVLAPIVLAGMIWNTVKIHHTQAATGLLYLAVVALLFGEFFSKFLLFAVRIPI